MAQHIPIQAFTQKRFRDIERGIKANFARTGRYGMKSSCKYIFNEYLTRECEDPNMEVYLANYQIPKSIYGDTNGVLEIHWNKKTLTVEHIYFPL